MKKYNLKYVVMSCIMLHNLCIELNDPCEPRWKLDVEELQLVDMKLKRLRSKIESNENRVKRKCTGKFVSGLSRKQSN